MFFYASKTPFYRLPHSALSVKSAVRVNPNFKKMLCEIRARTSVADKKECARAHPHLVLFVIKPVGKRVDLPMLPRVMGPRGSSRPRLIRVVRHTSYVIVAVDGRE